MGRVGHGGTSLSYSNGLIHYIHDNLVATPGQLPLVRPLLHRRDGRHLILGRTISAVQHYRIGSGRTCNLRETHRI